MYASLVSVILKDPAANYKLLWSSSNVSRKIFHNVKAVCLLKCCNIRFRAEEWFRVVLARVGQCVVCRLFLSTLGERLAAKEGTVELTSCTAGRQASKQIRDFNSLYFVRRGETRQLASQPIVLN